MKVGIKQPPEDHRHWSQEQKKQGLQKDDNYFPAYRTQQMHVIVENSWTTNQDQGNDLNKDKRLSIKKVNIYSKSQVHSHRLLEEKTEKNIRLEISSQIQTFLTQIMTSLKKVHKINPSSCVTIKEELKNKIIFQIQQKFLHQFSELKPCLSLDQSELKLSYQSLESNSVSKQKVFQAIQLQVAELPNFHKKQDQKLEYSEQKSKTQLGLSLSSIQKKQQVYISNLDSILQSAIRKQERDSIFQSVVSPEQQLELENRHQRAQDFRDQISSSNSSPEMPKQQSFDRIRSEYILDYTVLQQPCK